MITLGREVLTVELTRLAAKHVVWQPHDLHAHCAETTAEFSGIVGLPSSHVVSTGLHDDDARSLWNCAVKSGHHSASRVATDSRIDHVDVEPPRAEHGLEPGGIRFAGRDALAGGVAGSQSNDGGRMSR